MYTARLTSINNPMNRYPGDEGTYDVVEINREGGGLSATVNVPSADTDEPYDAAVVAVVGSAPYRWAGSAT